VGETRAEVAEGGEAVVGEGEGFLGEEGGGRR
jgi:hypothetical protein